jgi:hypothetical protein
MSRKVFQRAAQKKTGANKNFQRQKRAKSPNRTAKTAPQTAPQTPLETAAPSENNTCAAPNRKKTRLEKWLVLTAKPAPPKENSLRNAVENQIGIDEEGVGENK